MQLTNASLMATLALAMGSATAAPAPTLPTPSEVADGFANWWKPRGGVQQQDATLPLPARTIFQFPEEEKGVWLENLEVAPNGDLFMTTMWPSAALYTLRNPSSPNPQATLVHTFPDAQGLSGITATGDRCYVVVAAQYSALTAVVPGSAAIWSIEVPLLGEPRTRKITDLPEGGFLNGATTVPRATDCGCRCASTVLVSDSFEGQVWSVDTNTGAYAVAAKFPEMDPIEGAALPFGVNGIRVMNGHLYWANSNQLKIFRVRVDAAGTAVPGAPVETVATVDAAFIDDFDVDASGTIWLTTNADNKVLAIRPDGSWEVVVGGAGDLTVAGDSAAKFGRGYTDRKTLYVTTSGASAVPVNGTITEPAKVVAVDTSSY